jgi:NADH-quinone oxidoreductase subunit L
MGHEEGYGRYFAYLNLFMFAMLVLVLGANFLMLFVGWEGVGLCSYLLIGYYYEKKYAADAAKKAFVVNRIGDFGFILGIFGVFALFGTLDFQKVFSAAAANPSAYTPYMTLICLLLFVGACGKSAQFPLYVWLPDAMAGPTPVSALIHAATMVTAGVYMVTRCNVFFRLAPDAMIVVACVGAFTALFAATIGLVQNDIKKVLAYSTGVAARLHVPRVRRRRVRRRACSTSRRTRSSRRACSSDPGRSSTRSRGSRTSADGRPRDPDPDDLSHVPDREPDDRRRAVPRRLLLQGRDQGRRRSTPSSRRFRGCRSCSTPIALFTAGMTAFYMFRLVALTFWGTFRGTPEEASHIHESPKSMTIPLVVLAFLSVVSGYVGVPIIEHGDPHRRVSAADPHRDRRDRTRRTTTRRSPSSSR